MKKLFNYALIGAIALTGSTMLTSCSSSDDAAAENTNPNFNPETNEVLAMAQLNPTGHVVTVQADRETSYEAYFRMQEAIVKAYYTLRDDFCAILAVFYITINNKRSFR